MLVVLPVVAFCSVKPVCPAKFPLNTIVNGPPGPPSTVTLGTFTSGVCGLLSTSTSGFSVGIDNKWACTCAAVGETPCWNVKLVCRPPFCCTACWKFAPIGVIPSLMLLISRLP